MKARINKFNKDEIIKQLIECGSVSQVNLLGKETHREVYDGYYRYALIVSKNTTALKPVNDISAKDVSNIIEKSMLEPLFSVFIVCLHETKDNITDKDVAECVKAVILRLQPELRDYYLSKI